MWIRLASLSLLLLPALTWADDYKVIKLEQDMRNLERQVNELRRQVEVLERRESGELPPTMRPRQPAKPSDTAPAEESTLWYSSANWDRVKVGMNELDVIRLLGKPNSVRAADADSRTLLYALEIGSGAGFLSGSVELRSHQVTAVNRPVLK
jgi:hypothetical protein